MELETRLANLLDPHNRSQPAESGSFGEARLFSVGESINQEQRTIRFVCSSDQVDRYGEIIEPDAYRAILPQFMLNPVFMAGHIYVGPAGEPTCIGYWRDLKVTKTGLEGTAWFNETQLGEAYWQTYKSKSQRAVSVGFISLANEMRELEIDGTTQRVRVHTQVELLEISAVAIPANRQSLMRAAGLATGSGLASDAKAGDASLLDKLQKRLETIERKLDAVFDTEPGSRLCGLIQDVVAASQGCRSYEFEDDFDDPGSDPSMMGFEDEGQRGTDDKELSTAVADLRGMLGQQEP
jgi:HK97 family phage prohead protease